MTSKATFVLRIFVTMEAKLDELLKSVQSLSDEQKQSQTVMKQRLDQLEKDVSAKNEETTERVVKRLKRAQTHEFKRKGNEKQFEFNEEVKDRMETASAHIAKLPKETQEIPGLKSAAEELKEGIQALHTRQTLFVCKSDYYSSQPAATPKCCVCECSYSVQGSKCFWLQY